MIAEFYLTMRCSPIACLLLGLIFLVSPLCANIEAKVGKIDGTDTKSLVSIDLKNSFEQEIKDARIWVFLMNDNGEVVGNQSKWIIGGDSARKDSLQSEESETFKLTVDTQSKATTAKVTFSRIILADGTLADPRKSVVSESKKP